MAFNPDPSKQAQQNRSISKLHNTLPRLPLLTIYKSFIRPHLYYGDMVLGQLPPGKIAPEENLPPPIPQAPPPPPPPQNFPPKNLPALK